MPLSGSSLLKGRETERGVGDVDEFHLLSLLCGWFRVIKGGRDENESIVFHQQDQIGNIIFIKDIKNNMATQVHKIFISYHHGNTPYEGDKEYREKLERILATSGIAINYSVPYDAISSDLMTETVRQKIRDEYLRDATVTVVLVGKDTWRRKHVDWEIGSSIRDTTL